LLYNIFQAQSLFKQAAISLSFLPCNLSNSKQAGVFSFPYLVFPAVSILPSTKRLDITSISLTPFCIYVKSPLFPSINGSVLIFFLDWEGHHWASRSSSHCLQFPPSLQILQTHLTHYNLKTETLTKWMWCHFGNPSHKALVPHQTFLRYPCEN